MVRTIHFVNGYYEGHAVLDGKPLAEHPACSACVRYREDGTLVLQSYATDVIFARPLPESCTHEYELECTGTYSATTRKQIGWFLRQYFPGVTYNDIKRIVETDTKITAIRGE